MGKVNLRNRLRENNEDSNSANQINDTEIKAIAAEDINQIETSIITNKITPQPTETIIVEKTSAEDQLFGAPENKFSPPPIFEKAEERKPRLNEIPIADIRKSIKEPNNNRDEDDLFKDGELEDRKFKSLFTGTKKLFQKKEENSGINKNFFERLNINKRMFYIATGSAAIASILIISYLNSISATKLFGSQMVYVMVANKNISEKSVVTIADLARKEIPLKFVLPNALVIDGKTDPKALIGQIALTDIYENEQLMPKRFAKQEDSPWLSPAVPENHRAFNISSQALSYIKPKDHVDVLISLVDPDDKTRTINTPVLQNALVLAVDGKYKISASDTSTTGDTVTLAVPNKLVNFFTILKEKGNFQLALRKEGDTTNLDTRYSINQLEVMLNATDVRLEKFKPEPLVIATPKPQPKEVYVAPQPVYNPPVYNPPAQVYIPPRPRYKAPVRTVQPVVKPPVSRPVAKPVVNKPHVPTTVFVINGTKVDTQTAPGTGAGEKK
jgi:Flp pilus assembly protein CpaB